MKFDHIVKHNGIVYPAGTDVPVGNEPKKVEVEEAPKAEPKKTAKKEK